MTLDNTKIRRLLKSRDADLRARVNTLDEEARTKAAQRTKLPRNSRRKKAEAVLPRPAPRKKQNRFLIGAEARRVKLKAEWLVVAMVRRYLAEGINLEAALKSVTQAGYEGTSPDETEALQIYGEEAVERLRAEFTPKEKRPQDDQALQIWSEENIRDYLERKVRMQKQGLQALEVGKLRSDQAKEIYDRERAKTDVLHRFLQSNHLSSRKTFLSAAKIIHLEASAPKNAYYPQTFRQAWSDGVDEVISRLMADYA
ncbi:MAG TPA: hypothetical protein VGT78_14725 [Rhizomicrobium sp.]|nr:hypothetical protein [Rhizomicrobium sp.]